MSEEIEGTEAVSDEATPRATARPPLDREALLAALVLAPATYSRNRFFEMYRDPEVHRVRRRALQLRTVIDHLARPGHFARQEQKGTGDLIRLFYEIPTVGLRRTIALAPIEVSLLRCAIARVQNDGASLPADDPDRLRVEEVLSRLAPVTSDIPVLAPPV